MANGNKRIAHLAEPAAGARQVVEEAGLRVPQDVALAGFSNEPLITMIKPQLTSVDQRG